MHLTLTETQAQIAQQILKEIRSRLAFLQSVGLSYLTLSRAGGHPVRRREPADPPGHPDRLLPHGGALHSGRAQSIGLHQRDNDKLLDTLKRLRDLGNTLIVVEHDEDTMRAADYIVDIGPGAGRPRRPGHRRRHRRGDHGRAGIHHRPVSLRRQKDSRALPAAGPATGTASTVRGAAENNLDNVDVTIPSGDVHLRHRRVRFREVLSGQ